MIASNVVYCGSGSASKADLDPDPYPFQPNCVQFFENFQYTVQNIENCDTYEIEVKDITR